MAKSLIGEHAKMGLSPKEVPERTNEAICRNNKKVFPTEKRQFFGTSGLARVSLFLQEADKLHLIYENMAYQVLIGHRSTKRSVLN